MAMFNSLLYVYQRVNPITPQQLLMAKPAFWSIVRILNQWILGDQHAKHTMDGCDILHRMRWLNAYLNNGMFTLRWTNIAMENSHL